MTTATPRRCLRRAARPLVCLAALVCAFAPATSAPAAGRAPGHAWLHVSTPPAASTPWPLEDLWPDEEELAALRDQGYGSITLLVDFDLHISAHGLVTERAIIARHYLTGEGVRSLGSFGTSVRSDVEDLHLERAAVYQSREKHRDFDLNRAQIMTGAEPDVFSDVYNVIIPFEGLGVGSTAVLQWRVEKRVEDWPLPWSETYFVRAPTPVRRCRIRVRWDEGARAPAWKTNADFLACADAGERSLTCEARHIPPLDASDELRHPIEAIPVLLVTEPHTWDDLARAESKLVAASMRADARIGALTERVLGDAGSPWERLTRIHRFTADAIRYVAMEHGAAAVAPAPVARTADRRYGDCKDKVALFLAMAERAGLESYPVLVATERANPDLLIGPSWQYFDHMIACVIVPGRDQPVCIDQTVPGAGTGTLPPDLYGAVVLELRGDGARPATIPIPEYVWQIEIDADNMILCSGEVKEVLERRFLGPGEIMFRSLARSLSTTDRQAWLIKDYQSVIASEREPVASIRGVDSVDDPLVIETTTQFRTSRPFEETEEYVDFDPWLVHYANWHSTTNRKEPFLLKGVRLSSHGRFHVCPERGIGFLGPTLDFQSEFGRLTRRYSVEGSIVTVLTSLEMPTQTVPASQLDQYSRFLDRSLGQTRIWFGLTGKPETARGTGE